MVGQPFDTVKVCSIISSYYFTNLRFEYLWHLHQNSSTKIFWNFLQVSKKLNLSKWLLLRSVFFLNFRWARIWQCLSVCLCVCVSPKTLGQPGDFKNCSIWLKFCTLVPWVNIWGCFFHFQKFWFLGPGDEFFLKTRLKLWGSLDTSKIVRFGWNFAHLFLGWKPGSTFLTFWKFWFLGPGLGPSPKMTEKLQGSLGGPKTIRFWWNFVHLFLKWIPDWSWASAVSTLLCTIFVLNFSWARIWQCLSVCVPKNFGAA